MLIPITNSWSNLNDTPDTHNENINHGYDKADKHAHVKLGFLVNTEALLTLKWFTSV